MSVFRAGTNFVCFAMVSLAANYLFSADLKLASPFTDHLVLQREIPVPVWGWAGPNAKVEVTFGQHTMSGVADKDGEWKITLPPLAGASKPAELKVRQGNHVLICKDVVVGEVWICSGQSNMQYSKKNKDFDEMSAAGIRTIEVRRTVAFQEAKTFKGKWKKSAPSSAVAFSFAHHLKKQTEFPIGIVLTCWGSTSIEAWMPRDMVDDFPHFKLAVTEEEADKEGRARMAAALESGRWKQRDDIFMRRHSAIIYNAMMAPLVPFACRGIVWYQGERNARYISGMPEKPWFHRVAGIREYDDVLKGWIRRYRRAWGRDDLQFLIVMLPGYGAKLATSPTKDFNHPTAHSWAWMRESQLTANVIPLVNVVNTIDLGSVKKIHPDDKAPVGMRLALLAAKETLGIDLVSTGPLKERMEIEGQGIVVHFENAVGLKTRDGKPPASFWISNRSATEWFPAKSKIIGQSVRLTHESVRSPRHVRYAFGGKPRVNLINGAGLPAYPFRTDDRDP